MNIYALELNNDIKGIPERKKYIESLIEKTINPDLIVLPELALCSYIGNDNIWQYADVDSLNTSQWAMEMAEKYNTFIAAGYLEKMGNDYYNSYLIADKNKVYGIVRKSEGESYIFKRGDFPNIIAAPFGNVAIGICYDSRRKHIYDNIKDKVISLILFPHGAPSNPKHADKEKRTVDYFCNAYLNAFDVPVIYANSKGKLDYMLGTTGKMMNNSGFILNGMSAIYSKQGSVIPTDISEIIGWSGEISPKSLKSEITFYGEDIIKGNWLFRKLVLKPDIKNGISFYEKSVSNNIHNQ